MTTNKTVGTLTLVAPCVHCGRERNADNTRHFTDLDGNVLVRHDCAQSRHLADPTPSETFADLTGGLYRNPLDTSGPNAELSALFEEAMTRGLTGTKVA